MKLLLKQVIISDQHSTHNGQLKDIYIENGVIQSISDDLTVTDDVTVVQQAGLHASPGWVDTFSHFCDPGHEYKETIETGAAAAAAGGFTHAFTLPNTQPALSTKSMIEYVVQRAKPLPVTVLPLGAITKNAEGHELAEMYDMRNSGAVAFTDGLYPVQTAGLLLKALQYVKAFNGVVVQQPINQSMARLGLMSEGIVSTQMGLPGIPQVAEEIMVARDIELAAYTNSRLHLTGISTANAVNLIKQARSKGVAVTCSVTPYHLFFCDEDLAGYDTNLKVDPPLRNRQNMMALRQAVADGHIDCIASHHMPHDWDNKVCEFEYAKPGMEGLESCFMAVNTLFPDLPISRLLQLFTTNARQIFNLAPATIAESQIADITLFSQSIENIFNPHNIKSKCTNNAFVGQLLKGQVIGIINKDQLYLNQLNKTLWK